MTLEFPFEKWCHSYSHWPLTDHLLNTRNFANCLGNKLWFLASMNSTIVGWNKKKTSGNFSDSQKSDKLYLEYSVLQQPIHFFKHRTEFQPDKEHQLEKVLKQGCSLHSNYWPTLGKFLSFLLLSSFTFKVLAKNDFSHFSRAAEFKHLPLACSSQTPVCHHLGNSYALSGWRTVVLN